MIVKGGKPEAFRKERGKAAVRRQDAPVSELTRRDSIAIRMLLPPLPIRL